MATLERRYTDEFFKAQRAAGRRSAKVIVPRVIDALAPASVIDVGCGTGTWLTVFREHGITDIFGVDGPYVDPELLEIPREHFLPFNLTNPLRLERTFDLVLSLEVAEHLPWAYADTFVESLTELGPAVLFSAAIPYQGGTLHVNEQWPDFWAARFSKHGYAPVDFLRRHLWNDVNVEWWYAQNTLLYARPEYCAARPHLVIEAERTGTAPLAVVHPAAYLKAVGWERRIVMARDDLDAVFHKGEQFLWIDHGELGDVVCGRPEAVLFPQLDGEPSGPPASSADALDHLGRMRARGVGFAVFAWTAFWWFDYYTELAAHLRSACHCVLDNDRLVIFDLQSRVAA
jgi:SAM-dependent methyltransferase